MYPISRGLDKDDNRGLAEQCRTKWIAGDGGEKSCATFSAVDEVENVLRADTIGATR